MTTYACCGQYRAFRGRSIFCSFLIHALFFLCVLLAVRQSPSLKPVMQEYVVHLVDLPVSVEPASVAPVVREAPALPAPSERIRREVSPTLRRTELPRAADVPPPSFNEEAYRSALERRLQSAGLPRRDAESRSGALPPDSFSAEEYRKHLEARLGSTPSPQPQPKTPSRVTLPEIPRLASEQAPPVSASAVVLPPSVGVQMTAPVPAWYVEALRRRLEQNWKYGQRAGLLDDRALVSFTISRNGTVSGLYIEERSRSASFDQSALDAVRRSAPLPPLPPEVKTDTLDVTVEFSARGVR